MEQKQHHDDHQEAAKHYEEAAKHQHLAHKHHLENNAELAAFHAYTAQGIIIRLKVMPMQRISSIREIIQDNPEITY